MKEWFWKAWGYIKSRLPNSMHLELETSSGKECASIMLAEVKHPDHYFYLNDGVIIKSLCDLENVLKEMNEEVFYSHVRTNKNDFSEWVKTVVGDRVLARKLEQLNSKEEFAKAVSVRVNYLKKMADY